MFDQCVNDVLPEYGENVSDECKVALISRLSIIAVPIPSTDTIVKTVNETLMSDSAHSQSDIQIGNSCETLILSPQKTIQTPYIHLLTWIDM